MLLQHSGQAQGNATWTLVAVAFRLSRSMGLHRDPSIFPNIGVVEGELRRRLWYYLFQLELYAIGPATAIPAITEESYDTRLPHNLDDYEIVDGQPFPDDHTGYTEMSHYLFRCLAGKYYLSSLKVTSSLRKVRKDDFDNLIREIQAWGKKLEMEWLPKFNSESAKERLRRKLQYCLCTRQSLFYTTLLANQSTGNCYRPQCEISMGLATISSLFTSRLLLILELVQSTQLASLSKCPIQWKQTRV